MGSDCQSRLLLLAFDPRAGEQSRAAKGEQMRDRNAALSLCCATFTHILLHRPRSQIEQTSLQERVEL